MGSRFGYLDVNNFAWQAVNRSFSCLSVGVMVELIAWALYGMGAR